MSKNFDKGMRSEEQAWQFLLKKNYALLARRYKTAAGEIDLIVSRGEFLVFVEVKARKNLTEGLWSLRPKQCARMFKAAEIFLMDFSWHENIRFDFIILAESSLYHYENIYFDSDEKKGS